MCVWRKNDYPPGTFSLNALLYFFFLFLKIVLENYRWNYYERWNPLIFILMKSRSTRSALRASDCSLPCGTHLSLGAENVLLCFFSNSLWSVNTESTIAIIVLYTPYFFMLLRHDAQIFGLIFLNCLFTVSHYISDALDVLFVHMIFFFVLGPYWMEVSTWKN